MRLPKQTEAVERQVSQQPLSQRQPSANQAVEPSGPLSGMACELCSLIPDATAQMICKTTCGVGSMFLPF